MATLKEDDQTEKQHEDFKTELGNRLRSVEGRFRNRAEAAKAAGVAKSTLQSWIEGKRDPSFKGLVNLSQTVGVSLDWLATGEGLVHFEAGKSDDDGELKAQIQGIQAALKNEECPILPEKRRDRPDLDNIHQQLLLIARNQTISDSHRASADMILDIAFGNRSASQRITNRADDVGQLIREARKTIDEATAGVGWTPPPLIWQALHAIIFRYRVSSEDVAFLLDAMKSEVSDVAPETSVPT